MKASEILTAVIFGFLVFSLLTRPTTYITETLLTLIFISLVEILKRLEKISEEKSKGVE